MNINTGGAAGSGQAPKPAEPEEAAEAEPTKPDMADESKPGTKSSPGLAINATNGHRAQNTLGGIGNDSCHATRMRRARAQLNQLAARIQKSWGTAFQSSIR